MIVTGPINTSIQQPLINGEIWFKLGKDDKDKRINLKWQILFGELHKVFAGLHVDQVCSLKGWSCWAYVLLQSSRLLISPDESTSWSARIGAPANLENSTWRDTGIGDAAYLETSACRSRACSVDVFCGVGEYHYPEKDFK